MTKRVYMPMNLYTIAFLCIVFCTKTSHASLIDRGNGLIYDDLQNITWLQDANYAQTSGYDDDGLMTWSQANTWATNLVFQGVSNWRLFTRDIQDITCDYNDPNNGYSAGYYCTGSELGYLYYNYFGLGPDDGLTPENTDTAGIANMNMFINMQNYNYWDGSLPKASSTENWDFSLQYGDVIGDYYWNDNYAWAVADGDVALSISEPVINLLFMSMLLLLLFNPKTNQRFVVRLLDRR